MSNINEVDDEIESQQSIEFKDDEDTKRNLVEKLHGIDIDAVFEKIEREAEEADQNKTLWDRIVLDIGYKVNFDNKKHMVYMIGAFASMAGLLSGVDQSLISGANVTLVDDMNLTSHQQSLVSSLMPVGAVAGCLTVAPFNQQMGRRLSVMLACIVYTIGGALCAGAQTVGQLYGGRIFIGAGIGYSIPVCTWVGEISPTNVRGNLVSLYQFNIALGEVLGYAIAAIFYDLDQAWRYILGSSLLFSTLLFCAMFFLPESPRYLIATKGKVGHAYNIWKRLRDMDDVQNKLEFLDMIENAEQNNLADSHKVKKFPILDLVTNPRARRSLVYANLMIFLGQFTGVNAVMYYMSTLMASIGFSTKNSVFMSLVGGGSLMIGTIPAILWMDKCGRRFWANFCLPGFFLGLILLGISYQVPITAPAAKGLYLSGVILYMGFFGSYSTLTWVTPAEVYPAHLRTYGMTITSMSLYLWSFIITYNFNKMFSVFTPTGLTLGFYGGIAALGFVYQLLFVVETKGKSLEEIDDIFSKPTGTVVRMNLKSIIKDFSDICHGRFKNVTSGKNVGY
ncbi:hypothetical protein CANARDRAFT_8968 [[Candida] arabinofermentans NRRL YB-2248]|uniref:Major facilitator superfamily (MFS) profile domain-containing protein n=1 Tax=[Candida] arabinofermentans NRRL YB-2248 TaxID=983967 RepID=A0A1E4SWX2_9ASCO|nr:hypothetical protein CANARDRAFT_8968 [[Candida] arabinofermentans NRRL YB-2248]